MTAVPATPWPPPTGTPVGSTGWYLASDGAWYRSDVPPAPGWTLAADGTWGFDPDEAWRTSCWGLGDAWWGLAVYLVASTILIVVLATITDGSSELGPYSIGVLVLGNALAFVGVPWWASRRKGQGGLGRDFGLRWRPIDLAIGAGFGFGGLILAGLTGTLVDAAFGNDEPTSNIPVDDLVGLGQIITFFVAVGVVTPIIEEVFFRGLIHRSFLKRSMSRVWSGIWTTALFVVPHLTAADSPSRLLSLAASIAVLGGAFQMASSVTSNRLGAPIVAHFVVNGTAAAVLAFG
ncbi:MAG: hypothetical protein RLZZ01_1072 [Actinomycetota bacterium]|jgi:membrane protease YdiL (CAAX protease family)